MKSLLIMFLLTLLEMAEPVHREHQDCDCPIHVTGCDVTRLRKRLRFYRDVYLEKLKRATDKARKAHAFADRIADQTHEISTLIVSRKHMRQSKEGWREEALRLQEEVNKLKMEKEVQKV